MSRIGKKPIKIPDKVEVEIKDNDVSIKGPLGTLSLVVPDILSIKKEDNDIVLDIIKKKAESKAFWGLFRALVANIVIGVSEGFKKTLEIEGVGYKAEVRGKELVLNLGYSHPIIMEIPEGLSVQVDKSKINDLFRSPVRLHSPQVGTVQIWPAVFLILKFAIMN